MASLYFTMTMRVLALAASTCVGLTAAGRTKQDGQVNMTGIIKMLEDMLQMAEVEFKETADEYQKVACDCKEQTFLHTRNYERAQKEVEALTASLTAVNAELSDLNSEIELYNGNPAPPNPSDEEKSNNIAFLDDSLKKQVVIVQNQDAFCKKEIYNAEQMMKACDEALAQFSSGAQSEKIVGMLKKLRKDAFDLKSDAETGESGCGALLRTAQKEQNRLENSLKNAKSFRDTLQEEIDKLTVQRDDLDSQKTGQEEARATAKKMLTDLTARCQAAAEEYHTNSAALSQEVKNLTKGISILKKVFATELLQEAKKNKSLSFLQEAISSTSKQVEDRESIDATLSLLASSSAHIHSSRIATLALQIKSQVGENAGFDPFAKVRDMIENMVSMLKEEAAAETTKADWCAKTLSELKADNDSKRNDKEAQMVAKREAAANLADFKKLLANLEEQLADTETALKETTEELEADVALKTKMSAESFTQIEALTKAIEALNEAFTNNDDLGGVSGTATSRKGSGEEVIKILDDTRLRAIWVYAKAEQDKACQPDSEATFGWDAKFDDSLSPVSSQNCDTALEPSTVAGLTEESPYVSSTGILSDSIAELKGTIATLEGDIDDTKGKIGVEETNHDEAADLEKQFAGLEKSAEAALKARQKACVNLEDTYEARTKRREEEIQALEAALEVLETHSKNAEVFLQTRKSSSFLQMSK